MNWLNLNYFKCEPFELNFRLHVLGGFWPLTTTDRWKQIIFTIFSYVCYFSVTSMVAIQCLDIYLLRNDKLKLAKDVCIISVSWAIVVKSHLLLYNIDLVNQLKKEMTDYKETRTDPADIDTIERSNHQILTIVKTFYGITVPCVLVWMVYPAIDSVEEKKVPFPYVLPWEWTPPIHITLYSYQALSMLGFMINVLSVDSIFCGFVMRINAHYNIIIKKFKALEELRTFKFEIPFYEESETIATDEEHLKGIIRENIELHKKILHELDIFGKIYRAPCLVHFVGVSTAIGAVLLDTIILYRGFRLEILQRMLYVTIALWDTFLYCFCASKLQEKSFQLSVVVYSTKWYLMKPAIRRQLMFIIMNSQKVRKIYIGNLFPLEMSAFASLLKISYDITAVFYKTASQ